jgi:hypothetical protein
LAYATCARLSPLGGGPVVLPDGRTTRRFISSTRAGFRRARVSTKTPVCKGLPRRAYRNRTPRAPLPARKSGTDLTGPALLSGRERVWSIGILSRCQERLCALSLRGARATKQSSANSARSRRLLWMLRFARNDSVARRALIHTSLVSGVLYSGGIARYIPPYVLAWPPRNPLRQSRPRRLPPPN